MKQSLAAGMARSELLPHKLTIAIGLSVLIYMGSPLVCKFSMVDICLCHMEASYNITS